MAKITVYTANYCPYCTAAKQLLKAKGATFEEIDITENAELRTWLVQQSGQRTVPQIFINDKPYGGFSDISQLDKEGKLVPLLGL